MAEKCASALQNNRNTLVVLSLLEIARWTSLIPADCEFDASCSEKCAIHLIRCSWKKMISTASREVIFIQSVKTVNLTPRELWRVLCCTRVERGKKLLCCQLSNVRRSDEYQHVNNGSLRGLI